MSYISLLNETTVEVDNLSSDILSIATSFSSLGSTIINNTTLTGTLSGITATTANGSDLTYSYNPTTRTFTIQINNASITPSKLSNGTAQGQILLTGVSPFTQAFQTLNTTIVPEGTNLYYTDTRARLAISGTDPIIYTNSTGVISLNTTVAQAQTFTGLLTATTNVSSVVSQALRVNLTLDMGIGINYFTFYKVNSGGFKTFFGDGYAGMTYNTLTSVLSITAGTTITGLLTATSNSLSCISNSNFINVTNSTTNQFNPIIFITSSVVDGYKDLHYDNVNHLSINPVTNTLRITGGGLDLFNSSINICDATGSTVYGIIYSGGVNLYGTAKYMIGGVQLKTNDIPESTTNLYYTSLRAQTDAQLAISVFSVGCEIGAYYLGGDITLPPITTGSVSLSKLVSSTINKIIICNSLGVPTYSSLLSLTNIPTGTTGQILISNGTNNVWTTLSGDLTNNSGGGVTIGSGTVTPSKISIGTANQFLQTNSSLVNTWTTMSGDATLTNGVITIATNAITMSKILSSVFSMLAINGTLVQRDTSGGGTFTTVNSTDTTATNGTSDITIALNPTPSLTLGNFGSHTGVIILGGFASTASYSVIQKHTDHNLYIDNSGTNSVNIGTRSTGQSVNLGSLGGSVKFNGGRFNNFTKFILNPCAFVGSILTTWVPVYHTASGVCLSNSITVRGANPIKITVNMSLNNWGTVSSNHHLSLARSTVAFTSTTSVSYDVITPSGTGSVYGIQHQLAGTQYGSTNFTYLDTVSVNTANTTYWYCVIVRSNSAASGSTANIGNNAYTEITLEEIF